MSMSTGSGDEFASDINVTPMVDIMLVVLIIFMVITPLLQKGVTVNLPREMNSPDEDQAINKETAVIVTIPNNDQFYIGKDPFPKEMLGEKLKTLMEKKTPEERIVYIKSGIGVDYGQVVEVINLVRKADVDKIGLVADKKKGLLAAPK